MTLGRRVSFGLWEAYELVRGPSPWHIGILLVNLLVVAYLVWMLRRKKTRKPVSTP